jgi:hypothetical protein
LRPPPDVKNPRLRLPALWGWNFLTDRRLSLTPTLIRQTLEVFQTLPHRKVSRGGIPDGALKESSTSISHESREEDGLRLSVHNAWLPVPSSIILGPLPGY